MKNEIVIICGPTAVGKTSFAISSAKALNGEVVSADSMQIYKYMDIGSAKPSAAELAEVPHHLIGEIDPASDFSVATYQKMAKAKIRELLDRGKTPIISGGTGLYINGLIFEMDFATGGPSEEFRRNMEELAKEKGNAYLHSLLMEKDREGAERIHQNSLRRVIRALEILEQGGRTKPFEASFNITSDYRPLIVFLQRERPELYDRIEKRVDLMIEAGLVKEVDGLLRGGLSAADISMKGIGYKEIIYYLEGLWDLDFAIEKIKQHSRNYAKRQITWFKRYPNAFSLNLSKLGERKGLEDMIEWIMKERR